MASKQALAVLLFLAASLLPFAMGADIVVGDGNGWMPDFNYTEWAATKSFTVGDNLGNWFDRVFNHSKLS